jgi:hypothetical protein
MKVTKSELEAAKRRADATLRGTPHATHVHYDRKSDRIVIGLSSGIEVAFRPRDAQGLEDATPHQLGQIEISPSGLGIHFPRRDADIYLPALLEGFLGSKRWIASQIGRLGGSVSTKAKAHAARRNGKLGGRPKIKEAA